MLTAALKGETDETDFEGMRPGGGICALAIAALLAVATPAWALDDGLALTPPMGWNSWDVRGCHVTESFVHREVDALVASGMAAEGYRYVVIDDCWMAGNRTRRGFLQPDYRAFPHGMAALADYIHSKGLLFGLYLDLGSQTCQGRAGSWGHFWKDAYVMAAWGADYVKLDWCNWKSSQVAAVSRMRRQISSIGRPMVISLQTWGWAAPWTWASEHSHLWRTAGDLFDNWRSFLSAVDHNAPLSRYAGAGHWNDPDLLQVGNGGMNANQDRAQYSLWAEMAAPLMASTDLTRMSATTRETLTNPEVIAIDQDPMGVQGHRVIKGSHEVWTKALSNGDRAIVFFNRSDHGAYMSVDPNKVDFWGVKTFTVRNVWTGQESVGVESIDSGFVPAHSAAMLRVHPLV